MFITERKITKGTAITLFFVFFLLSSLLFVQSANAVSISPLTFELIGNPGDEIGNILRVRNDADYPVGISIDVEDFVAAGEEGGVVLESPSENLTYSLAKWVTVTPSTLELDPQQSGLVEFKIDVPLDAEPGGHYASILANISASAPSGGVGVAQKVGSLVLLNVTGDVQEKMHIAEFSAPEYSEYGPVQITTRFENTGTIHLKPRGFILVKNIFGKEIQQIELPQKNVLPNSIRRIETEWGNRLMFGRYEATLTAIYGSSNEPLASVTNFWIVPWKIVTAVGVGIIILLILVFRGRKRLRLAFSIIFKGTQEIK